MPAQIYQWRGKYFSSRSLKRSVCAHLSPQFDVMKSSFVLQYKNFQIEESPKGYHLYGTDTVRPTLGELLQHLESQNLRSDNHHFKLVRCCPPQPRGERSRPGRVTYVQLLQTEVQVPDCLMLEERAMSFCVLLKIKDRIGCDKRADG